jgi:hypothetical protein
MAPADYPRHAQLPLTSPHQATFARLTIPAQTRQETVAATTLGGRAGLYIDGRPGNLPASSHGRRYAESDREQPGLTRRYPR